jgi:hypothetical protein
VQAADANVAITAVSDPPTSHQEHHSMSIARTLVAALAVTALAVPAAQARPADMHASVAQATAKAQQKQGLRSPDAIDASQLRGHGAAAVKQDLRSPDAIDASQLRGHGAAAAVNAPGATAVDSATRSAPRTLPAPPTWPVNPQPIAPAHGAKVVDDGGLDWAPIALGIVGGLLAVGAVAVLTTRRRRMRVRLAS